MIKALVPAFVLAMASLFAVGSSSLAAGSTTPTVDTEASLILTHARAKRAKCKKGQVYSKKAKKCVAVKAKKAAAKKADKTKK